ncbi:winged helix-turn-helix transcriptional regulator [Dickeya solani]|uniref:Helix-turn-helix domain-containing protein n=1 Tax=Dickeya solani TaxID=1089444 RepID=A0AAX4EXJ8_9GAMM|nr:helix-turn-helix domain-containing protein [Dickeya solani]WOA52072.1 helix-turn-helix domain-containing protein [Dickeya solani]
MKSKALSSMLCPVARSIQCVGDGWGILILRDALAGLTRFDEFQTSLSIAPNILTRRLKDLVAAGLLEKSIYCKKPPRYEYLLTATGKDFQMVIMALMLWGNDHLSPDGKLAAEIIKRQTGRPVRVGLVDLDTHEPVTNDLYEIVPGPYANERMLSRFEYIKSKHAS